MDHAVCTSRTGYGRIVSKPEVDSPKASLTVLAYISRGVINDTLRDRDQVCVCRDMRTLWPEFWKNFLYYG